MRVWNVKTNVIPAMPGAGRTTHNYSEDTRGT